MLDKNIFLNDPSVNLTTKPSPFKTSTTFPAKFFDDSSELVFVCV